VEARELAIDIRNAILNANPLQETAMKGLVHDPILGNIGSRGKKIICRQAGDCAIILDFGDDNFDIRSSFSIYYLIDLHRSSPLPGVIELTPGVRTLHILYSTAYSQSRIIAILSKAISSLDPLFFTKPIPSQTFHLPLAFQHSSTLAAVERYTQTIRSSAPWLPNNVDFIQRVNGLTSPQQVTNILLDTTFLILGLGEVFCGAPCAIPLDPRHRLFGMKCNPSRSFTPEGTVGIGGQYMCIYSIDSPGGYQLVGRTVPIWNRFISPEKPWMFNAFDRIKFYLVSEEELDASREAGNAEGMVRVEEGMFDLQDYEKWLEAGKEDIERVVAERRQALKDSDVVAEALRPPPPARCLDLQHETRLGKGEIELKAHVAGKCWKCEVKTGDVVEEGQTLVSLSV